MLYKAVCYITYFSKILKTEIKQFHDVLFCEEKMWKSTIISLLKRTIYMFVYLQTLQREITWLDGE